MTSQESELPDRGAQERDGWRRYAAVGLVLLVGSAISAGLFIALRRNEQDVARRQFEQCCRDRAVALRQAIESDFFAMRSLQSLYASAGGVSRQDFRAFVAPLVENHPNIQAVQWAPRTGRTPQDEHFPIALSEPCNATWAGIGFDLSADRACREAMRRAEDLGKPALSERIRSASDSHNRREVKLFVPIYRKDASIDTLAARRQHLRGFLVGTLSPRKTLEDALRDPIPSGIDVSLVDSTDPANERPLCYHRSRLRPADDDALAEPGDNDALRGRHSFDVGGRRWTITCAAVPQFIATWTTWHPWGVAAATLLLTGLSVVYWLGNTRRAARMSQLAVQLTESNRQLEQEIAERQQTESTLETSQTKYRTLYELSSEAIILITPEAVFLAGNAAALALFGCKDESELLCRDPVDLSPEFQPDGKPTKEKAEEMLAIALREGKHAFEWRHKRLDGTEFSAIVTLRRMEIEGRPFCQGTIRDVSEQRRTQEALRVGERRLRLFVDNVNDVVWTMDFSGHFTYMSPSMQQMLGHPEEDGGRLTVADIVAPASLATAMKTLKAVTADAYTVQHIETRVIELELLRRDGTTVWNELTFSGLSDELGEVAAIQGVARDISERKQAEQRQARLLARLQGVNHLQEELLLPGEFEGKLRRITQAAVDLLNLDFCRIWLVRPGDLCHGGCMHATAEDETRLCHNREKCLHLMASSGRYPLTTGSHRRVPFGLYKIGRIASNGNDKFITNDVPADPQIHDRQWARDLGLVSFAGHKLRDDHGNPIGVFAMFAKHAFSEEDGAFFLGLAELASRVVIEQHAADELRETRTLAIEANQMKTRFLAGVSHEIRTRMTAILGHADLLMDPAITASSQNNYAAVIRRNGERLVALVDDMLDASMIESASLKDMPIVERPAETAAGAGGFADPPEQLEGLQILLAEDGYDNREGLPVGEVMISLFSNDPEMAAILGEFIGRLDGQVAAIRQALDEARYDDLQRLAHRLKGAGGSYGYPLLTDVCKTLEGAAKTKNQNAAEAALDGIVEMCAAIQRGYAADNLLGVP